MNVLGFCNEMHVIVMSHLMTFHDVFVMLQGTAINNQQLVFIELDFPAESLD